MIPDWDADCVFLSDRLAEVEPRLYAELVELLQGIPTSVIHGTADIWCRDFMPIQVDADEFCQFAYRPDYLRGHEHLITPPEACRLPFMSRYRAEPIVLDGGNVVASRTKVILTDKVYKENRQLRPSQLRQRLEEVLRAEVIIIPKEPYDPVGHADAVVRFVAEDRVLINDYSRIDPLYGRKLKRLLEPHGLEIETLPLFHSPTRIHNDLPSAVGLYLNYMRVGDRVILPAFDRAEDDAAFERLQQVLPDARISQLPCRGLAERGGVLNCITWTCK
jgi:agmatine deiminase